MQYLTHMDTTQTYIRVRDLAWTLQLPGRQTPMTHQGMLSLLRNMGVQFRSADGGEWANGIAAYVSAEDAELARAEFRRIHRRLFREQEATSAASK